MPELFGPEELGVEAPRSELFRGNTVSRAARFFCRSQSQ